MKRIGFAALLLLLLTACATAPVTLEDLFTLDKSFGDRSPYGDNRHPGIDYGLIYGTPIVAAAPGRVVRINELGADGAEVLIRSGKHFSAVYAHLSECFVKQGQGVKRGQLIGLSGASNDYGRVGYNHLHFGLCKTGAGDCHYSTNAYDPDLYWLGGKPACFDPGADYSAANQGKITLPVACGEYNRALRDEAKAKR